MNRTSRLGLVYGYLLALFLTIESLVEFASGPIIFGNLTTNVNHALIHLVLGVLGIGMVTAGRPGPYAAFVGFLLLIVGVLYFFPGPAAFLWQTLNMNDNVALLNLVIGVVSLFVSGITRPDLHQPHKPTSGMA
ncbi:MAG TPA: DUF4383 domain-containing protein [Flavobacteriales bacterium]|nr:DUF4383 domain-containing protein [Flavobacteriales bacterium]